MWISPLLCQTAFPNMLCSLIVLSLSLLASSFEECTNMLTCSLCETSQSAFVNSSRQDNTNFEILSNTVGLKLFDPICNGAIPLLLDNTFFQKYLIGTHSPFLLE